MKPSSLLCSLGLLLAGLFSWSRAGNEDAWPPRWAQMGMGQTAEKTVPDQSKQKPVVELDFPLACLAFSPDDKYLVGVNQDGVWVGLAPGKDFQVISKPARRLIDLALSPDGKTMALSCNDGVHILDFPSGKERMLIEPAISRTTSCLAFSPDGKLLALGGEPDGIIRICKAKTGKEIRVIDGHRKNWDTYAGLTSICFPPNGRFLASGGTNRCLCLWEVATGEERWSGFRPLRLRLDARRVGRFLTN